MWKKNKSAYSGQATQPIRIDANRTNEELENILNVVENFSKEQKPSYFFIETKLEATLASLALTSLVIAIALFPSDHLRTAALVAAVLFFILLIVLIILQAWTLAASFHVPLKGYASSAHKRLTKRLSYIDELASHSPESLDTARKALRVDSERMNKRLHMLVGAVEKAGLIPAALTLFYVAMKAGEGSDPLPGNLLLGFVLGLYAGAFVGGRLIEQLELNIACLDEAYEAALQRPKIEGTQQRVADGNPSHPRQVHADTTRIPS